jgi:hypothetical protein
VDTPLESEYESHKPDKVNFSCPQVSTRSTKARGASCSLNDIPEELSPNLHENLERSDATTEHPTPFENCRAPHVTAIQGTAWKESEWRIARLSKTSSKACFA